MMRKYILILLIITYSVNSQSLSVFDIDTSSFPIIKAKFYAFDANGNQILNLSPSDFEVTEDGVQRNVTKVSCPAPKSPIPLSSVLTIDVSGSMSGSGLAYAKEAAKAWVQALPLGQSECAITTFNSNNFFNQDYTTNRNRLLNRIEELTADNGTDYDAAFINKMAGGLLAAEKGKYRRIVILLTDSHASGNESAIIQKAQQINTTIFCVIIAAPCQPILKKIAEQTGGQWFENISTAEQAREVYLKILNIARGGEPCEIEWESNNRCTLDKINVKAILLKNGAVANTNYTYPKSAIVELRINPESVKLFITDIGIKKDTTITITAVNSDFNVTNINYSCPDFTVTPTSFNLASGQSKGIIVSYLPVDSGYTYCKFEIENDKCPMIFHAVGGYPGARPIVKTLKLIKPNGGETFVVGNDTTITWEGILPSEYVKIDYSTNNGTDWILITNDAKNLSYSWTIPKTPSKQCLARVTSNAVFDDMVLIHAGTFMMGDQLGNGYVDERPLHEVILTRDFYIGMYEVTQKKWKEIMGNNPSINPGDNNPVENVSFLDMINYCNKLSVARGLNVCYTIQGNNVTCDFDANGFRLPTEAEWEYACRAGTTTEWNIGVGQASRDRAGWFSNTTTTTREVGLKEPNNFGLYDMHGNVWEMVWDWWDINYYSSSPKVDPTGPANSTGRHTQRGGSYIDPMPYGTSSDRLNIPSGMGHNFGFRVVSVNK